VADHSRIRDHQAALVATRRALDLAVRHRHRFHVFHVSTGAETELLADHRELITGEVCPHHLLFNVDDYDRLGILRPDVEPRATQQMLDDASLDVEAWLSDKLADRFSRLENAAFVIGDGSAQPRGFLSYPTAATADAARPWGTLEHVGTGVNGDFAAANPADVLMDLIAALKPGYLANAGWVTRRAVIARSSRVARNAVAETVRGAAMAGAAPEAPEAPDEAPDEAPEAPELPVLAAAAVGGPATAAGAALEAPVEAPEPPWAPSISSKRISRSRTYVLSSCIAW
jgi:hypothetical protein